MMQTASVNKRMPRVLWFAPLVVFVAVLLLASAGVAACPNCTNCLTCDMGCSGSCCGGVRHNDHSLSCPPANCPVDDPGSVCLWTGCCGTMLCWIGPQDCGGCTTWTPDTSTVCQGVAFTQTRSCGPPETCCNVGSSGGPWTCGAPCGPTSQTAYGTKPCFMDIGLRVRQGSGTIALAVNDGQSTYFYVKKGGVIHNVSLVLPADPNASQVRVMTPIGVGAVKRCDAPSGGSPSLCANQ